MRDGHQHVDKGRDDVMALLSLISSSAHDAMEEYRRMGLAVPTTTDTQLNDMDTATNVPALKKAIRVLEGACEQLCASLAQPMHTMFNRSTQLEAPLLRIVLDHKIPDILADYPKGLHVSEIGKMVGIEGGGKLVHVLRHLSARHCFQEDDVFANNRLSLVLRAEDPTSAIVGWEADENRGAIDALPEVLGNPNWHNSALAYSLKGSLGEDDLGKVGGELLWSWYQKNPDKADRFNRAMIAVGSTVGGLAGIDVYPWKALPSGTTVCDVGSGIGSFSVPLARAHPHLKITLQDLPGPLATATEMLKKDPDTTLMKRISCIPIDFLKESPVPGLDIYYMRHIIHDWTDKEVTVILGNVCQAMNANSRLLIHDYILPTMDEEVHSVNGENVPVTIEKAPPPLLYNYGAGNIRMYNQDVTMFIMQNSQERTLKHLLELVAKSGLKATGIYPLGEQHILELKRGDI